MAMALYTIIRIYEVPAENRIQATDRMLEALTLGVEEDYHVKDVLREPGAKQCTPMNVQPTSWWTLIREQLGLTRKR